MQGMLVDNAHCGLIGAITSKKQTELFGLSIVVMRFLSLIHISEPTRPY